MSRLGVGSSPWSVAVSPSAEAQWTALAAASSAKQSLVYGVLLGHFKGESGKGGQVVEVDRVVPVPPDEGSKKNSLDPSWASLHATQLARLLPATTNVVGFFANSQLSSSKVAGAIQLAAKTLFQNGEIEFFPTLLSAFVDNDKAFAKGSFTVLNLDGNDVKASGGVRVIAAEPINVANRTVFTVKYPFRISAALPKGKQLLASIRDSVQNECDIVGRTLFQFEDASYSYDLLTPDYDLKNLKEKDEHGRGKVVLLRSLKTMGDSSFFFSPSTSPASEMFLTFSGTIHGAAVFYAPELGSLKAEDVINALVEDVRQSLRSRFSLWVESFEEAQSVREMTRMGLEGVDDEEDLLVFTNAAPKHDIAFNFPHRIFFDVEDSVAKASYLTCDYLLAHETVAESKDRCAALFALDKANFGASGLVKAEVPVKSSKPGSVAGSRADKGGNGVQSKKEENNVKSILQLVAILAIFLAAMWALALRRSQ